MPVELNYLAILVAAAANMVVGALWYSPFLFGSIWRKATHHHEEHIKVVKWPLYFAAFL